MAKFLEHIPCPLDSCGSSDACAVYEQDDGSITGWCFACNRYVANPYTQDRTEVVKQDEESSDDYFHTIQEFPSKDDPSRGLFQSAMAYYETKTELSQQDGITVVAHCYPYTRDGQTIAYKVRRLPKDIFTVGSFKNVELFGQKQAKAAGGKRLWITEGEIDAISLFQTLKSHAIGTQWASINPAVVSIPTGAPSAVSSISRNLGFVKGFEQIVLVFDQDEEGKEATKEVLKLIPEALVVDLPLKDANDMVMGGREDQLAKLCLFNAQKRKP
jgi:twinkle protein